uniref:Reverse transcriptase Ty1/copia-type domain-containing protein n=1 Tax=Tanacetum cinerariifolium TaxID=118510 RepID=A0A699GNB3_TANCI|nr:hypothetical protein [Tanacetum cinerariifolium]
MPQHNGVSGRRNRTLLNMVRSMMSQTTLPKSFWDYAFEFAARILNMVPTKKVDKTPYKETMGYSFYYPPENKVFVARNAEFLENSLTNHKASGSLDDLEIFQDEDTYLSLDTSLNHKEDDQEIDEPQRDLREPANYKAALLDPESNKWLNAMNVEMQFMKDNEVWELVMLPPNGKVVVHKWLFKKKTDMNEAVHTYKARLVAKGFTQTSGIDYEETFSPVADIRAIRILIAIAAFYDYEIWQIDVKNAFLNGYLNEEVYMEQLEEHNKLISIESRWYKIRAQGFCYTNDGYLTDANDMKSQIAYVLILNGGAVDWKSTKQSIFATSFIDNEYIAAFDASKEAVWIHKFISGFGVVPTIKEPINMYYNNT